MLHDARLRPVDSWTSSRTSQPGIWPPMILLWVAKPCKTAWNPPLCRKNPVFFFCVCESPNHGDHSTSPIPLWPVGSHARIAAPFSPSVPRSTWCSGANALRFSHNEIRNTLTIYHHLFGQNIIEVSPRKWNTVKERDPIAPIFIYIYISQMSIILCIICLSHSIIIEYQRIHYLQNVIQKT